jgi:Amt family ammonium transporter
VHGTAGIWGIFAVLFTNPAATFTGQLIGTLATFAWMFGASFIVLLVINKIIKLRVSEEEEMEGMDINECGMTAYPEFTPEK